MKKVARSQTGSTPDPEIAARLVSRRTFRLTGKASAVGSVPEGPELIGPRMAMPIRSARTDAIRVTLLDTAELLFARWGYTGVSIRDVTDLANMRLANISYHFGSKQNLYCEVLRRRAEPLSQRRLAGIDSAIVSGLVGEPLVSALVDAYLDPALEFIASADPGWKSFFQLMGHVTFSRLWMNEILKYFNGPASRLMDGFRQAYPGASEFQVQSAVMLMIGPAIFTLAQTGRIETFENPAFASDDLGRLEGVTKKFMVGGIVAVLTP